MRVILVRLTQGANEWTAIFGGTLLVLTFLSVRTAILFSRAQARLSLLLKDSRGQNLESLLYDHLREKLRLEAEIERLKAQLESVEERLATAKRHVGLVRYDAFEDVRGNQSFALAMYDDEGNGAVLTGIVGRVDSRVYCKPLSNGRSERDLSQEEQRAIKEAKNLGPKPIVSP